MRTAATMSSGSGRAHWGTVAHILVAAILVSAAIAGTWPIWAEIFRYALENEEQSHSLLAVPVAAWLFWVRRSRLTDLQPAWGVAGPVAMVFGWILASVGFRSGVDVGLNVGALLIVVGAGYSALGFDVFRRFLPAIAALALVLPVPGRIRSAVAGPLQEWSAQIAQFVLDLVGVPVLRSGNVLTVASVPVTIAEACNGMRMVSALAVITYAFVFSYRLRPSARIILIVISPILALGVNVLRLIPTALCYGYASQRTADAFHDLSGWAVLALAIALLLFFVRLLRWLEIPIDQSAAPPAAAVRSAAPSLLGYLAPVSAITVIAGTMVLGGFEAERAPGLHAYLAKVRDAVNAVPYQIGGAVGIDQVVSPGAERLLRPNAILQRRYTDPQTGASYGLTIVHCADARDLLDHYPPVCYPAHGWKLTSSKAAEYGRAEVRAQVYDFVLRTEAGDTYSRVVSFFVLPGQSGGPGKTADSMDEVDRASRSPTATALGAAHIMISFAGDAGDQVLASTLEAVLEQLEATSRTIGGGIGVE